MQESFEVATAVGLGTHPETGARTAVPIVTVTSPKPVLAIDTATALDLAANIADGAEAAELDARRVQDAIDAGETSDAVLRQLAQGQPNLSVVDQ